MSGGSLDYVCFKVDDAADCINVNGEYEEAGDKYHRKAFVKHLRKVAKALRAIEWNMSGDGDDGENRYIEACIDTHCDVESMLEDAREINEVLSRGKGWEYEGSSCL